MSHRVFNDSLGRKWDAWTVIPSRVERRKATGDAWSGSDRRHHDEFRVFLGGRWTNGWLAFETKGEKRRLSPIPDKWEEATPTELEALCMQASLVTVRIERTR